MGRIISIGGVEAVTLADVESGEIEAKVGPSDQREEIRKALESGDETRVEVARANVEGCGNTVMVAYFPRTGVGAACYGGGSEWVEGAKGVGDVIEMTGEVEAE